MNSPLPIFFLIMLIGPIEILTQITEGLPVPPGVFVFQVKIMYLGEYNCLGGIIDETHIITAAHCVADPPVSSYAIIAGRMDRGDFIPQWRGVKKIHLHQNFSMNLDDSIHSKFMDEMTLYTYPHDIAVVTLRHPLIWSDTVGSMVLSKGRFEDIYSSQNCMVAVWTDVKEQTPSGTYLKAFITRILSRQERVQHYQVLKKNEFYGEVDAKPGNLNLNSCGLPLACDARIFGILISPTDISDHPHTFLALRPYIDFIEQSLND